MAQGPVTYGKQETNIIALLPDPEINVQISCTGVQWIDKILYHSLQALVHALFANKNFYHMYKKAD